MKEIPADTAEEMVIETTPEMGVRHLPMPMYSTPAMVGHIEGLCLKMLIPLEEQGESSVGYRVDVRHKASTPIGLKVMVKGGVKEQDGRKVVVEGEAYKEGGTKIGVGIHVLRVIDPTS